VHTFCCRLQIADVPDCSCSALLHPRLTLTRTVPDSEQTPSFSWILVGRPFDDCLGTLPLLQDKKPDSRFIQPDSKVFQAQSSRPRSAIAAGCFSLGHDPYTTNGRTDERHRAQATTDGPLFVSRLAPSRRRTQIARQNRVEPGQGICSLDAILQRPGSLPPHPRTLMPLQPRTLAS
jgi:hypothetical protein